MTGLMVDSDKRSPLFPDVPTIPEATAKEYASRSYFGLVAPPGTPKPIAAKASGRDRAHRRPAGFPQAQYSSSAGSTR